MVLAYSQLKPGFGFQDHRPTPSFRRFRYSHSLSSGPWVEKEPFIQSAKGQSVEASNLVFGFWAIASGVILSAAAVSAAALKRQSGYLAQVLDLIEAGKDGDEAIEERIDRICHKCKEQTQAAGVALYVGSETDTKKILQAGNSAEVTGPGVVRDLLMQAMSSGTSAEAVQGGRFLISIPVASAERAALLLFWEREERPDDTRRTLLEVTARLLSLLLPGLQRLDELGSLRKKVEELEALPKAGTPSETGEEFHLASVGRLAAGVAHELNTPLGAVLTMVGSLLRKEEDANKAKRLTIIKDAVEKCRDIITKLMVYSRSPIQTETGLTFSRFVRTNTDLNAIIRGIGDMMTEELKKDGIEISLSLGDLPAFRANGSQWSHVFTNLIANARDALKEHKVEHPQIAITTKVDGEQILITVDDNGPGVPESHRSKIFEPFFTTKEVGRGTGLGLAIVREIVRKHEGDIVVATAPSGGASFQVRVNPNLGHKAPASALPKEQYP